MTIQDDIKKKADQIQQQLDAQTQKIHDHHLGLESRLSRTETDVKHILDYIGEQKLTQRALKTGLIITGFGCVFTGFVALLFKHL